MAMLDILLDSINKHGWMSISSLFFDNAYNVFIPTSGGYIAYSKSNECFFNFNSIDTTDTDIIENTYVSILPRSAIGQQQVLTVTGQEHLQHFNIALYSQYRYLPYADKAIPYPKIPTEQELAAMTANPDTGLYDKTDTIIALSGTERSVIDIYKDTIDYSTENKYSGANIDKWKEFYVNHTRFKEYLRDFMGVTDAI